ncbi:DUF4878 domain-containing protein [Porphyromonas sp. COT-239 OH1446]|uniref:DUF4878 domain-containing protein n=1 Tax=Porphyromonas sp. COT-239 OH1446 TaxID=1515613 RepID=UPI0009DF0838|nr:DUF4878 domain-containing protein [Porphyromonas sp. COT-239 OH1446]
MMKKAMIAMAFAGLALVGLSSCESGPEKATRKFYEYLSTGQIEEAEDYCTERTERLLEMAAALGSSKELNPNFKFKLVEERIEGREAWVKFTDIAGKGQNDTTEVYLIKVDDDWKVDIASDK